MTKKPTISEMSAFLADDKRFDAAVDNIQRKLDSGELKASDLPLAAPGIQIAARDSDYQPKARTITIPEHLDSDFHEWQLLRAKLSSATTTTEKEILEIKLANAARALLLDVESLIEDTKYTTVPQGDDC